MLSQPKGLQKMVEAVVAAEEGDWEFAKDLAERLAKMYCHVEKDAEE